MLPIDLSRPVLIFTDDAEDAAPPDVVIVVDTRKVIVVPFEFGISLVLIYTTRKVEGRPSLDNVLPTYLPCSIMILHLDCKEPFRPLGSKPGVPESDVFKAKKATTLILTGDSGRHPRM